MMRIARVTCSNRNLLHLLCVGWLSAVMAGCETLEDWAGFVQRNEEMPPSETMVMRVTGYAAYDVEAAKKSAQFRLDAVRASRLDAYRALAERVYGTRIISQSQVSRASLTQDSFVARVDSSVRGAQVISVSENTQGTIETVVELILDTALNRCLVYGNTVNNAAACRIPLPSGSDIERDRVAYTSSVDNVVGDGELSVEKGDKMSTSSSGASHGSLYFLK